MYYAQLLLPDFALILCGYMICRLTKLDRTVWEQVDSLVYYFLFPVLLFHSMVRAPINLGATSSLIGAAWLMIAGLVIFTYSVARWRGVERTDFASGAQAGFRFNTFIGFALISRLSNEEGALLFAVIVGMCVPLLNVAAVWPMARDSGAHFGKTLLRNPLILSTAAGLLANLAGFSFPAWAEPSVTRIGQSALVMGLMTAGAGLQLSALLNTTSRRRVALGTMLSRHLLAPLLAVGCIWLFKLDATQATVLLAFSGLPTASSCYVLASRMGYDGTFVAGLVTLSTLLGMLSLPFALSFR
jgi:malonate transporter and related proteins